MDINQILQMTEANGIAGYRVIFTLIRNKTSNQISLSSAAVSQQAKSDSSQNFIYHLHCFFYLPIRIENSKMSLLG